MADVYDDFRQVGKAVGEADRADQVVAQMRAELTELSRSNAGSGVRMLALEWLDPLMIAGNWVPELVEAAGAESLLVGQGVHSHWIEYEQIERADPDVIVLMPCGYGLDQTLAEARPMFAQAPWSELRAVKAGAVYAVDGHHLFNRPGPRLVQSARVLAEIVRITSTADHALDRIDPALSAFIARI
jgi:iron complex transport system substrate-binding protein